MFSEIIYNWLDVALDYGITEFDFWNMTIAEISRAIESKKRVQLEQDKKQASHFYILADMVGRSVSRIYNANSELPPISKVYP